MARDFYRRDYDSYKPSRRDNEEAVIPEQSRHRSKSRSNSRPAAPSRYTTEEWAIPMSRRSSMHSEPGTDPRLRIHAAKSLAETALASAATTGSSEAHAPTSQDKPLQRHQAAQTTKSPMQLDGSESPVSLVDSIASALVAFSNEAYSAAYARQCEEAALNRLAAAEKTDQQNRRGNKGWVVLIEQGEEDKKTATRLLQDAKVRTKVTKRAMSTAAMTAATRIVELARTDNQLSSRAEDAERIIRLEATVSTLTKKLAETTKTTWENKITTQSASTEATKVRVEILDPIAYTVATTSKHVASIDEKVEILTRTQNKFESLMGGLCTDFKTSKDENKIRENKALAAKAATDQSVSKDVSNLQATVAELSERLNTKISKTPPVERDWTTEIDRIDASIKNFDAARKSDHELLESRLSSYCTDLQARFSSVAADRERMNDVTYLRFEGVDASPSGVHATLKSIQADLQGFREERKKQATRISTLNTPANAPTLTATGVPPSNGRPQKQMIELEHEISILRTDSDWLKEELRKKQEDVVKLQLDMRTAMDLSKGNVHSIRALTQRYNNLTTEDMVNSMLRQLERLYPHASQIQASFDAVWKEFGLIRNEYGGLHQALGDHVNKKVEALGKEIRELTADVKKTDTESQNEYRGLHKKLENQINECIGTFADELKQVDANAKKSDTECRALSTNVVTNVKSQRDTLETEIHQKLEELDDAIKTRFADLESQVKQLNASLANGVNVSQRTSDKLKLPSEPKEAGPRNPDVPSRSPSTRSSPSAYLAAWQRPAQHKAKQVIEIDTTSDSSDDAPISSQSSRTRLNNPLGASESANLSKKRKRNHRPESPDVLLTEERPGGSAAVGAKVPRMG